MPLKNKLIHFLGGFTFDDFTPVEQAVIRQMGLKHQFNVWKENRRLQQVGMLSDKTE